MPYGYAYEGAGVSGGGRGAPPSLSLAFGGLEKGCICTIGGVSGGDEIQGTSVVQASWEPAAASNSTSKRATNAHASIEMVRGT